MIDMIAPDLETSLESKSTVTHVWTRKINVLLLYINYPLAMGTYFKRALQRRTDVDLKVCGSYTGSWIPWMGGMSLPEKYAIPPDIPLPFTPDVGRINYEFVKTLLGSWEPDLVIACDAGVNWADKPCDGYSVTIATDPHCLDYSRQRRISDKFFNMQKCYMEGKDIYLPYAYDPTVHYIEPSERAEDAVLIGMPYEHRVKWVDALRKLGVSVVFENGPIFDEYRALANSARLGLNWSSLNDLNARAFETAAFGLCPIMNRVPDLPEFFKEDIDYLGFSTHEEAVAKVLWAKSNPDACIFMSLNAMRTVQPHTYDARVETILKECSFI